METKIVIIGAGSASFGPNTLASLMRNKTLRGSHISLVDLDSKSLDDITLLAKRMNREWDSGMSISSSTDRSRALPDATFVVISIEVTPREALWRLDWEIPVKHGLRQPYAENGGPGGFMHACRQIGPFMKIVRDMENYCPDAWIINYSNPLPRITRAVTKYSDIKIVGKCHQLDVGYGIAAVLLSKRLGLSIPRDLNFHPDPSNIARLKSFILQGRRHFHIEAAGLNHFTWMVDVRDRATGEDLYPELREAMDRAPAAFEPLSLELFKTFGCCPVPGDAHLCEYLPWTHDANAKPWEYFNLRLYDWKRYEALRDEGRANVAAMAGKASPMDLLLQATSEGAAEIVEAINCNSNYYDEAVNIPNSGSIPNLPDEAIVEVPAVVSSVGPKGVSLAPLPSAISELCRREAALVEMVVDAAVTGSRELALQTLLLDPMINDIRRAKAILDDYLTTFADYLPQFA